MAKSMMNSRYEDYSTWRTQIMEDTYPCATIDQVCELTWQGPDSLALRWYEERHVISLKEVWSDITKQASEPLEDVISWIHDNIPAAYGEAKVCGFPALSFTEGKNWSLCIPRAKSVRDKYCDMPWEMLSLQSQQSLMSAAGARVSAEMFTVRTSGSVVIISPKGHIPSSSILYQGTGDNSALKQLVKDCYDISATTRFVVCHDRAASVYLGHFNAIKRLSEEISSQHVVLDIKTLEEI